MTNAIQFANKMGSRNEAVVIADCGDKFEVRVWVNPTSRFRGYTEMVEKRWVRKMIRLNGLQEKKLAEAGA